MLEKSLDFMNKATRLVNELEPLKIAEVGKPVVDMWYRQATEETHDYIIGAEPNGKGACLIAYGDDVVFREFGAGVMTYSNTVFPNAQGLPPIHDGSWSATEGTGEYAKYGSWHHKKQKYVGIAPTLGMYNAYVTMKSYVERKAKEVMK